MTCSHDCVAARHTARRTTRTLAAVRRCCDGRSRRGSSSMADMLDAVLLPTTPCVAPRIAGLDAVATRAGAHAPNGAVQLHRTAGDVGAVRRDAGRTAGRPADRRGAVGGASGAARGSRVRDATAGVEMNASAAMRRVGLSRCRLTLILGIGCLAAMSAGGRSDPAASATAVGARCCCSPERLVLERARAGAIQGVGRDDARRRSRSRSSALSHRAASIDSIIWCSAGYFDDSRFFRVVPGFIAQFGIPGDPTISRVWKDRAMTDDSARTSNVRGTIAYAMTGAEHANDAAVHQSRRQQPARRAGVCADRSRGARDGRGGSPVWWLRRVGRWGDARGQAAADDERGQSASRLEYPKLDRLIRARAIGVRVRGQSNDSDPGL